MIESEIQRLRPDSLPPGAVHLVTRLLEERERLLEALRAAAEALRFVEAPPQLSIAAEAALAFAEAPAT